MKFIEISLEGFKKFTQSTEGKMLTKSLVDVLLEYKEKPSTKSAYIGRMVIQFLEFMEKDMEIVQGHLIVPFIGMILKHVEDLGITSIGVLKKEEITEKLEKVFISNGNDEVH
jgi:hypothetical protein